MILILSGEKENAHLALQHLSKDCWITEIQDEMETAELLWPPLLTTLSIIGWCVKLREQEHLWVLLTGWLPTITLHMINSFLLLWDVFLHCGFFSCCYLLPLSRASQKQQRSTLDPRVKILELQAWGAQLINYQDKSGYSG